MPSAPQDEPLAGEAAGAPSSWTGGGAGEAEALADIDAEIADHLATAAADIARRGQGLDEAEAISRERFGDVAGVRRKCWWIQQGDQIMFRWLGMALLASLIIAVLGLAAGGWRVQTAVADRIDQLAEELASIHRDQQQLLSPRPAETVPEIRGRAFLGDASHPAADAEIEIWNASEMKLFRRLRTDREGRFRSRSLPPGDYFALAPLLAENGKEPYVKIGYGQIKYRVQSQPLYVYAGSEPGDLELDLQLRFGQISFEIVEPAPTAPDGDAPTFVYRSQFILAPFGQGPDLPTDPNGPLRKPRWPVVGGAQGPWHDSSYQTRFGGSATEPLHSYPVLMAGQYKVAMMAYPFVTGEGL
ncbi:MAG TPA: hypothetical protein VGN42_24540, partial [Pirellulales bacterium]|nr:hypothetical protein [Pirellulales bacterium]